MFVILIEDKIVPHIVVVLHAILLGSTNLCFIIKRIIKQSELSGLFYNKYL